MYELPKNFRDKIVLDDEHNRLLMEEVIDLGAYKENKTERDLTRWSCQEFVRIQRGSGNNNNAPRRGAQNEV